jgi:hypothetical protein
MARLCPIANSRAFSARNWFAHSRVSRGPMAAAALTRSYPLRALSESIFTTAYPRPGRPASPCTARQPVPGPTARTLLHPAFSVPLTDPLGRISEPISGLKCAITSASITRPVWETGRATRRA